MKVVDRYLVFGYLRPLIFCTVMFVTMFVFVDSFNNLDDFIKQETPIRIVAAYYAALVPLVIQQIMPASVLFSALYFLGHLNRNNEITALKAGGMSASQVLGPILLIGLTTSFGMLAMNELVMPEAALTSAAIKEGLGDIGKESDGKVIRNVTLVSEGNRMVFARELIVNTNTLHEVIILEHNEDLSLKAKTTAKKGVWSDGGWTLYNVVNYELDPRGNIIGKPITYKRVRISLRESPLEFIRQGTDTQFMNYLQLKHYIDNTHIGGSKASNRLMTELHHKLVAPFACFIILLVGAPFALRVRRGGALVSLGLGLGIVALYYFSVAVAMALGKGGTIPPTAAAWTPHATFFCIGLYLTYKHA